MIQGYSQEVKVGEGGMGCVYKAVDNHTGQTVAVKMMSNQFAYDKRFRTLFATEAQTLADINHPSVVKIMGSPFTDQQGNMYLPMEFVEGETIKQRVSREGPYSEQQALALMDQILDAMQTVYLYGKIHRDIKPSNIMLRPNGTICIIDFGIAKDSRISTGMTVGTIIGTDGYMSPEQANGYNIDHRTDIYSLGCLLFYMLAGRDAIQKATNDHETRMRVIQQAIPDIRTLRPDVSATTAAAIIKATDKNMTLRFQTPQEFRNALSQPYQTGGYNGTRNTMSKTLTIGKSPDCDIVIADEYVSRKHATISIVGNQYVYFDMSKNGSVVGGRVINNERVTVAPGTEILLANRIPLPWVHIYAQLPISGVVVGSGGSETLVGGQQAGTNQPPVPPVNNVEPPTPIWVFVVSLVPIVGIILWVAWRETKPTWARTAGIIGLIMLTINFLTLLGAM